MPKPLFFTEIETAWKVFKNNIRLIPLLVFIDFLFYYVLIKIHFGIFTKAAESIKAVSTIIQQQVAELSQAEIFQLNKFLMQNPDFVAHYNQILKYIGLFFVSVLLIWILLKGVTWFLTQRMTNKKIPVKRFAVQFILMSLFWFVFYMIVIMLLARFLSSTTITLFPTLSPKVSSAISFFALLFVTYLSLTSIALIPSKKILKSTFTTAVKSIKKIMPAYLLVLVLLFVVTTLPISLFKIHYALSLSFIILISLPSLSLGRIYFISVVKKTEDER